jgi:hypothetical protein
MKCQYVQERMIEYSEHGLNHKLTDQIEDHLRLCPQCAQELRTIKATLNLLHTGDIEDQSSTFWRTFTTDVMREVRKSEPVRALPLFSFPRLKFVLAGILGFCLLMAMAAYLWVRFSPVTPRIELPVAQTVPAQPDSAQPQPDLQKIASAQLAQDMMHTEFALFDGTALPPIEISAGDDVLDILLDGMSVEEKHALLAELQNMKHQSQ